MQQLALNVWDYVFAGIILWCILAVVLDLVRWGKFKNKFELVIALPSLILRGIGTAIGFVVHKIFFNS